MPNNPPMTLATCAGSPPGLSAGRSVEVAVRGDGSSSVLGAIGARRPMGLSFSGAVLGLSGSLGSTSGSGGSSFWLGGAANVGRALRNAGGRDFWGSCWGGDVSVGTDGPPSGSARLGGLLWLLRGLLGLGRGEVGGVLHAAGDDAARASADGAGATPGGSALLGGRVDHVPALRADAPHLQGNGHCTSWGTAGGPRRENVCTLYGIPIPPGGMQMAEQCRSGFVPLEGISWT